MNQEAIEKAVELLQECELVSCIQAAKVFYFSFDDKEIAKAAFVNHANKEAYITGRTVRLVDGSEIPISKNTRTNRYVSVFEVQPLNEAIWEGAVKIIEQQMQDEAAAKAERIARGWNVHMGI